MSESNVHYRGGSNSNLQVNNYSYKRLIFVEVVYWNPYDISWLLFQG